MERPTGYLGKSWEEMSKKELLAALFKLIEENEKVKRELERYEADFRNIPLAKQVSPSSEGTAATTTASEGKAV